MDVFKEAGTRAADVKHQCVHVLHHLRCRRCALDVEDAVYVKPRLFIHIVRDIFAIAEIPAHAVYGVKQTHHLIALRQDIQCGNKIAVNGAATGYNRKPFPFECPVHQFQSVYTAQHFSYHGTLPLPYTRIDRRKGAACAAPLFASKWISRQPASHKQRCRRR